MTTNTPDDYDYNARELAKARPYPEHPEYVIALQVRGPKGASRWLSIDNAQYWRVAQALTTDPGITYRVQAHDINTLTWPMWDACGIECPAMIGADCPGKGSVRCPGHSSKWSNAATEVVYGWSLHWQPETCGDVDQPIGFNAIFRTPEDESHDDNPMAAGVILSTDSQGNVTLSRYETPTELDGIWSMLQDEEAKYFRANCENCAEFGVPCDDHGGGECEDSCGLHVSHDGPCAES